MDKYSLTVFALVSSNVKQESFFYTVLLVPCKSRKKEIVSYALYPTRNFTLLYFKLVHFRL